MKYTVYLIVLITEKKKKVLCASFDIKIINQFFKEYGRIFKHVYLTKANLEKLEEIEVE